jgi:hypothetical protein
MHANSQRKPGRQSIVQTIPFTPVVALHGQWLGIHVELTGVHTRLESGVVARWASGE